MKLKNHQTLLLVAGALSLAIWWFGPLRPLLLPLLFFNTHIHELCHALTAFMTGGSASSIEIHGDSSGVTMVAGGIPVVIGSAGYVGSAIVGGIMVWLARTERGAQAVLVGASVFIGASLILLVRGDWVGWATGAAWLAVLIGAAWALKDDARTFAAQFLGLNLCLSSLHALLTVLNLSLGSGVNTDAMILQKETGIPSLFWAVGWAILGTTVILASLKYSWTEPSEAKRRVG